MCRSFRGTEFATDGLIRRRVVVVAVNITQQAAELIECRGINAPVALLAVARPGLELIDVPAGLGHADNGHAQVPTTAAGTI